MPLACFGGESGTGARMIEVGVLPRVAPARVLACGAHFRNRACLIEGGRVLWSKSHGDLVSAASRVALDASLADLLAAASGPLQAVAHDLQADSHSTRAARSLAGHLGVPAVAVQHQHAHIAVVQAEHGRADALIGVALDGIGLGDDGVRWGGEILWVNGAPESHQWRRLDHLPALPLPGGELAVREPWRMAAAVLQRIGRHAEIETRFGPVVGARAAAMVANQLRRGLHCPTSTSAGRWFDAAAGALGISVRQCGEEDAAAYLEKLARIFLESAPDFSLVWRSLDPTGLVGDLFALAQQGPQARAKGAAAFHLGLASGIAHRAIQAAEAHAAGTVALGGSCFRNALLSGRIERALRAAGLEVVRAPLSGCGDAGLALGQAWVAGSAIAAAVPSGARFEAPAGRSLLRAKPPGGEFPKLLPTISNRSK